MIPPSPQPGQPYAFVDREAQVAQLYKPMVNAGNAALAGKPGGRVRAVVHGYVGVGKSSVIYQVLQMVRSSFAVVEGQRVAMPPGLVEPASPERWLILRASGKHVPGFDAIPEAIRALALSALDQIARDAERDLPGVLPRIGLFHRLFTRDKELQAEVRSALDQLVQTIDLVRQFEGAPMTRKREWSDSSERTKSAGADFEAQLKARAGDAGTPAEGQAAIKTAASILSKSAASAKTTSSVERQIIVGTELAVEALNAFFARTDRAGIPTILVLDDFDEFASKDAATLEGRAAVLRGVLGFFSGLAPTCFVIGVRQEYMDDDLRRQYPIRVFVPPMDRATALHALKAWGDVQEPSLSLAAAEVLRDLGERCVRRLPEKKPVVVPFQFLQMISNLCNHLSNGFTSLDASDLEILQTFVKYDFSPEVVPLAQRIATAMPDADIERCAAAEPLDPKPYELTEPERRALRKEGLLRPAFAGASEDERIVLDPLLAYLAAAQKRMLLVGP
jgi:Cdc6-like AAA superfamily ATPase